MTSKHSVPLINHSYTDWLLVGGVPLGIQRATTKGRWSSTGHTTWHYQGSVELHMAGHTHSCQRWCKPSLEARHTTTTATPDSTTPVKQNMFHYNSGQTFGCVDKAGRIYAVVDYCIGQSPVHHRCSFEKHNCTGIVSFLSPPISILFHLFLVPVPSPLDSHVVSTPHSHTVSPPCSHIVSCPRSLIWYQLSTSILFHYQFPLLASSQHQVGMKS